MEVTKKETKVEQQKTNVDYFSFLPPELIVEIIKYLGNYYRVIFSLTSTRHLDLIKRYTNTICNEGIALLIHCCCSLETITVLYRNYNFVIIDFLQLVNYVSMNYDPRILKFVLDRHEEINSKLVIDNLHHFIQKLNYESFKFLISQVTIELGTGIITHHLQKIYKFYDIVNTKKNLTYILRLKKEYFTKKQIYDLLAHSVIISDLLPMFQCINDVFRLPFNKYKFYDGYEGDSYKLSLSSSEHFLYNCFIYKIFKMDKKLTMEIIKRFNLDNSEIVEVLTKHLYATLHVNEFMRSRSFGSSLSILNYYSDLITKDDILKVKIKGNKEEMVGLPYILNEHLSIKYDSDFKLDTLELEIFLKAYNFTVNDFGEYHKFEYLLSYVN